MAKRLARYGAAARVLHYFNLLAFIIFFYTGAALLFSDSLATIIGGSDVSRMLHRIAAVIVIIGPLIGIIIRFGSFKEFVKDTFTWQKGDTKWVLRFFIWLFRPSMEMPHTKTKDSAGQRMIAWILIGGALWQVMTGVILLYRNAFSKNVVLMATTMHDVGFFVLIVALMGHIYVGLGLFKPYRGIVRAMFGDGTVDEKLAKRLWPDWAKKAETGDK